MKLNSKLITNNYFFVGFIIVLVGILTGINNYYFYDHVKSTVERNAFQLESILKDEIEFCRNNRISGKRYRENIEIIVRNFAKNAYYNNELVLRHEEEGVLWERPIPDWDNVTSSKIEIVLPKLKSDHPLYYNVNVEFDIGQYFISVIRSMTLSVFDKGEKFFNSFFVVSNEDKQEFKELEEKLEAGKKKKEDINFRLKEEYKKKIKDDEQLAKLNSELSRKILSAIEYENYKKLKEKIINSSDAEVIWKRSRPALGFTIFAIILAWFFRRREIQRIELEIELEKEKKNREILDTFRTPEQNDDMDLYDAVMKNDISKLKNIKSANPTMNIIKFNAMVDHTEEEKLRILEVLIEKGIDLNFHDEDGMTALMYYAIGNVNHENDSKIIETLIKNGIDINAQNKSGMTALMLCSVKNRPASVDILIKNGADINIRHNLTAKELAATKEIEDRIREAENHTPQKLVKLLSNFTIDTPFKLTTHLWENKNDIVEKYGDFDGYMCAVKKQFEGMKSELEELSSNLSKKIHAFLVEENPDSNYSWCSKTDINIGWSSVKGLKEHCDSGKLPKDFRLSKPIFIGRGQIATFGEIVDLFKQEIEIRAGYQLKSVPNIEFSRRDFYTDTQNFATVIAKIFDEMHKRKEFEQIEVSNKELEDRSIEIKITQIGSFGGKNASDMLQEIHDGDFADIKKALTNLCDWSIESAFEGEYFRVNFLHSNNVKDVEMLQTKPNGFTHILRFYK
ncbi:ankyrin repeat domain-containing protein [bacterium]|nr:ankyrin repeat domain-containing protein [bacterium]MBU1994111.1 ankyrin repeat domain-containing protein [bacterium]